MASLSPGDEVVCVDAKPREFPAHGLSEGAHYIVTDAETHPIMGHQRVLVAGANAHPDSDGWFYADRFRHLRFDADCVLHPDEVAA